MATGITRRSCYKCPKGYGNISCAGCQRWMCKQHFNQHQQELNGEMDLLCQDYDRVQDDLSQDDPTKNLFFSRIDHWQRKSIEKIHQIARETRSQIENYLDERRKQLRISLSQIGDALRAGREADDYTELELKTWSNQIENLRKEMNERAKIRILNEHGDMSQSIRLLKIRTIDQSLVTSPLLMLRKDSSWSKYGVTVAGDRSAGKALHQLNSPYAVTIDHDDQTLYIADYENNRIVSWQKGATCGELVINADLNGPAALIIDDETGDLVVSELRNRRITRWSRSNPKLCEILISNIRCYGLAFDDEKSLYVSDCEKHEVRRYRKGETDGILVAGGHGAGDRFNQLNAPRNIFIDRERSIFISDSNNHRVMKWTKDDNEGKVIAGGEKDLSAPRGLIVDGNGSLFVVDQLTHRVVCWLKNSKESTTIIGGNGQGTRQMNLSHPMDLCFDRQGEIYVADYFNHRIQRFSID